MNILNSFLDRNSFLLLFKKNPKQWKHLPCLGFFEIQLFNLTLLLRCRVQCYSFKVFSRSEFVITLTELNAIAPAATAGLSIPSAAKGIPKML